MLEEISGHARSECFPNQVCVIVHRENDDFNPRQYALKLPRGIKPI